MVGLGTPVGLLERPAPAGFGIVVGGHAVVVPGVLGVLTPPGVTGLVLVQGVTVVPPAPALGVPIVLLGAVGALG